MAHRSIRRVLHLLDKRIMKKQESYGMLMYGVSNWHRSKSTNFEAKDSFEASKRSEVRDRKNVESRDSKYSSDDDDLTENKKLLELDWLTKALEPAFQFCKRALPSGNGSDSKPPSTTRSIADIVASIQKSKTGLQDWSFSDLTIGLYLIYLRQASANPLEDISGVQITSESLIEGLIYHLELAHGCYKGSPAGLAELSMLRESNILKYIKNSSVMRPGYYIGIDPRKKLVILGIRGTHTVYDLVTDIVSTSDGDVTFEGYSTHFGTAEAARWFLEHEMETIKKCLHEHENFKLRLVGHSLGGATASLLAIMLRRSSARVLGFDPNIVTAVGYGTPPCVSKELAESCCDFVTTVVMQDDMVPRLSVASLARLRTEIIETDWMSVLEKEDWKSAVEFLTNAKQVVSSVQDVARRVADYAKFKGRTDPSDFPTKEESLAGPNLPLTKKTDFTMNKDATNVTHEELFVPGAVYFLKRNLDAQTTCNTEQKAKSKEYFTLWKRNPAQHFQRISLSSNLISDHKCESHYYALRDVIKGLPASSDEGIF